MATFEEMLREVDWAALWNGFREDLKKFDLRKACCGYSLQNGLLVIAILDVMTAVLGVLPLVITLMYVTIFKDLMRSIRDDTSVKPMESAKTVERSFVVFLAILTLVICVCLLEFYLAMLLLNGAKKKKLTKCYLWWKALVVLLIAILFGVGAIVLPDHRIWLSIVGVFVCLFKIYGFWIVKVFIAQIGTNGQNANVNTISEHEEIQMHKI